MINGWSTKRRAKQAGKIWVVQMYRMACGKDIEQPLTHTWQIETVFCSIICFWLIFLKLLKKMWFDCGGSSGGFCLCRRENKWFQPQIENSLMPAHNWWRDKNYPRGKKKTLLPQRASPFAFKNPSSSLIWVASLHPAVTVVPGHEFGISAPRSTSCLATDNHRKVLMQSKIIGISSPLAIIN